MKIAELFNLEPLLSDRVRLAIMVTVYSAKDEVNFKFLITELNLTKGNLSSHIRKLDEAGLIKVSKTFEGNLPKTSYLRTKKGRKSLNSYLAGIENILKNSNGDL